VTWHGLTEEEKNNSIDNNMFSSSATKVTSRGIFYKYILFSYIMSFP